MTASGPLVLTHSWKERLGDTVVSHKLWLKTF